LNSSINQIIDKPENEQPKREQELFKDLVVLTEREFFDID